LEFEEAMIKATKQAEKISVLLHSSSCHVSFNDKSLQQYQTHSLESQWDTEEAETKAT
jgi:hypothetical protein